MPALRREQVSCNRPSTGRIEGLEPGRAQPQQGAATSALLAASPLLDGIGGRYFADCNEATLVDHRPEGFTEPGTAVAPYALDPENARRLWELSLAAVL